MDEKIPEKNDEKNCENYCKKKNFLIIRTINWLQVNMMKLNYYDEKL